MQQRATMRDVAEHAGVSMKTVSRVVNHEDGVSQPLLAKVREALEALGYRPNLAASNLRRGLSTRSIGVLLQDIGNSFSATVLRAIADLATSEGSVVFSASLDEEDGRERDLIANLASRRVDGLIVMPASADQSYLAQEVATGLIVVMADRPPRGIDVDSVLADNVSGAESAVVHLAEHGHRRIALLCDDAHIFTAVERRDGYRRGMRASGLPLDVDLQRTNLRTEHDAYVAVRELLALADPPTAIFAARNVMSIGSVRALRELGSAHRVALVGFDDFPLSDLLDPPISVIRQDARQVGHQAATLLFERIGGYDGAARHLVLPTTLVERGSGEIRP